MTEILLEEVVGTLGTAAKRSHPIITAPGESLIKHSRYSLGTPNCKKHFVDAKRIQAVGPKEFRHGIQEYVAPVRIKESDGSFREMTVRSGKKGSKRNELCVKIQQAGRELVHIPSTEGIICFDPKEVTKIGYAHSSLVRVLPLPQIIRNFFGLDNGRIDLNGGKNYDSPLPPQTLQLRVYGRGKDAANIPG